MNEKLIATPSRTKEILQKHNFTFKKSLGQNFLTDLNILENIINVADLDDQSQIVEVGPGIGSLTEFLARTNGEVVSFEIDQRLLPVLEDTLAAYDNVTVVNEDILEANLQEILTNIFGQLEDLTVVANLPYYITTPIMLKFIESDLPFNKMVMMMQKEVAERIVASPGSKAYGSLSIAVQYYMEASIAFIVPSTAFVPAPNVDSAILKLTRRKQKKVQVTDEKLFFRIVKAAFKFRRKTIWNNLIQEFGKTDDSKQMLTDSLQAVNLDPKLRGEAISIEEFGNLANEISKRI